MGLILFLLWGCSQESDYISEPISNKKENHEQDDSSIIINGEDIDTNEIEYYYPQELENYFSESEGIDTFFMRRYSENLFKLSEPSLGKSKLTIEEYRLLIETPSNHLYSVRYSMFNKNMMAHIKKYEDSLIEKKIYLPDTVQSRVKELIADSHILDDEAHPSAPAIDGNTFLVEVKVGNSYKVLETPSLERPYWREFYIMSIDLVKNM